LISPAIVWDNGYWVTFNENEKKGEEGQVLNGHGSPDATKAMLRATISAINQGFV